MRHSADEYQGEGWKLQLLTVTVSMGVTSSTSLKRNTLDFFFFFGTSRGEDLAVKAMSPQWLPLLLLCLQGA